VLLLFCVVGYFALAAHPVPRERAHLYAALFLLGGITTVIGDVFYFRNPALQYIYWLFPPNTGTVEGPTGMARFGGINMASLVVAYFLLARYGIRGLFNARAPWRIVLLLALIAASMLGGYRSFLIAFLLAFGIQFCLEGLHRTRLLLVLLVGSILIAGVVLPFVQRFPSSIQRALAFLPVPIDPVVRQDAEASSNWRVELWKSILPQVPEYFWLGKGYVFTKQDYDYAINQYTGYILPFSQEESWAALAGDYHNGPLSVIIPFGVWGAAAFLWFLAAGWRVVYLNYRYGDPNLRIINSFLLAGFITRILIFMFIFGAFDGDMHFFVGYLGFSVCLNGGVCRRALELVRQRVEPQETIPARSGFQPAYQRSRFRP
jgi:O-antigen ligase